MRKLLALALYLFLGLPAILGTLFLVPLRGWVLDRNFYKSIVSGPEARAVLESPALYERIQGPIRIEDDLILSGPAAGRALRAALPVPELLSAAGTAVDSAFDALERGRNADRFTVNLVPLKRALDKGIPEFARIYSSEVPVGPAAVSGSGLVRPGPGIPVDLSARPVSVPEPEFRAAIRAALAEALAAIPDTADSEMPAPGPGNAFLTGASSPRDALNRTALWMALLAGGIWVAGAFVASDSMARRLRWLGGTLVAPGIVVLVSGLALGMAADPLVLRAIQDPELQRALADPALKVVRDWIHRPLWIVSTGFLVSGSVAVIVGGGLSASRRALRYRDF